MIKYEAYQSAKLDKALVSKEVKAKVVAPTPTAIKQTAHNAFELTFDSNIELGGYYANLKDWETEQDGVANDIYYKLNDVKVPFSSVKATTPKENVLKVTMYGSFVGGETYYVQIAGKTFDFEAAGNTAKYVTALEFTSNTALVNTNAKIKYKLLNAVGIDITETALEDGAIEFTTKDTDTAFVTENTIYFYKVGEKANVTGTFTYYDVDDNYKAYPTTNSTVITAVEEAPVYKTATWSINCVTLNDANNLWRCWNGQNYLPVGDRDAYVNVYATFTVGDTDYDIVLGDPIPVIEKELKIKVADEHYAMITNNLTGDLDPVKTGATSFLLYYTNDDEKDIVVASLPFTVTEKRKATTITASASNVHTGTPYLNTSTINDGSAVYDQIKIWVTVKDQYGKNFEADDVKLAERNDSATNAGHITAGGQTSYTGLVANAGATAGYDAAQTFDGDDFTTAATDKEKVVSFNVTAKGLSTVVSFRVKDAGDIDFDNSSIVPYISATSINTTLTASANYSYCHDEETHLNYMNGSYYAGRAKFYLTDESITTGKDLEDYADLIDGAAGGDLDGVTMGSIYVARVVHGSTVLDTEDGGIALTSTGNTLGTAKYKNDRVNFVDLANSVTLRSDGAATLGGVAVPGAERARWQIDFDSFDAANNAKLHGGSYTVMYYKITDADNTDDKCKVTPLGSRSLNVTDNQELPTIKQLSQVIDGNTSADIEAAYEIKWNGDTSAASVLGVVANGNIRQDAGALYVYDIAVTIKTYARANAVVGGYTVIVPVGELLTIAP